MKAFELNALNGVAGINGINTAHGKIDERNPLLGESGFGYGKVSTKSPLFMGKTNSSEIVK